MNKGDKVRIKDAWGTKEWEDFEAEVIEDIGSLGPYLKPLSDRPDGNKRHAFYWPGGKLELISEEKTFEIGDKVRVVRNTVSEFGISVNKDVTGVIDPDGHPDGVGVGYIAVTELSNDSVGRNLLVADLEIMSEEKQTIEVGDTVKATHAESGSVIQGVASFVDIDYDGLPSSIEVEVNENGVGTLDLYTYQGWEFELIAKEEVQPKVGDVAGDAASLPIGAVTRTPDFSGTYLHTAEGWRSKSGNLFTYPDILDDTIIVYLPPTASE